MDHKGTCGICQQPFKKGEHVYPLKKGNSIYPMVEVHRKCQTKMDRKDREPPPDIITKINASLAKMDKLIDTLQEMIAKQETEKVEEKPKFKNRIWFWSSLVSGALLAAISGPVCAQTGVLQPGSRFNPYVLEKQGQDTYVVRPEHDNGTNPLAPGGRINPWVIERRGQHGDLKIHTPQPYSYDQEDDD